MGTVKIVKASAGSGKTFNLAYEYVRDIISEPMQYRHTLAVTFTNKATEEMKQRIISEIHLLAEAKQTQYLSMLERELNLDNQTIRERAITARTKILHDYSRFSIVTIDKFFQRIIRSFIKELGIDLNFNLELQTDTLLSRSADELIDTLSSDEELRRWVFDFIEEKIADNQKWDIKEELMRLGKEIFSEEYQLASSASQTRTQLKTLITENTAKALAIEQTLRKSATKALDILSSHNLSLDDFPFKAAGFAGYFKKIADGNICAYGIRVSEALLNDAKWYAKTSPRMGDITAVIPELKPILEFLHNEYDKNVKFLTSVKLLRSNYRNFALLNDLSEKIQEQCIKGNIMPISETNNILRQLISNNDTPFIFEKAGNHFSKFMIDEFQDTSTMQWENFIPLLQNAISQSDADPVLLVGDVKQSIYRWRGGDWQILAQKVNQQFHEVKESVLGTNFRSLKNVVQFNNHIIGRCVESDNAALNSELDEAKKRGFITPSLASTYTDLLKNAYAEHEQKPKDGSEGGYINITKYGIDTPTPLIPPVISRIEELQQRGYKPNDIAILVRYNNEGVAIANMLLDHKGNNPDSPYCYDVVTQEALSIGASDAARFVIAAMTLAVNPEDTLKLAQYNTQLNRQFNAHLTDNEKVFLLSVRLLPPQEAFERIVAEYKLGEDSRNIAYLQALHEQVITFSGNTIADISIFIKWWEETGKNQSVNTPQNSSAITIISIHKAKGLQYKVVILPYCNWDLNPNHRTILWAKGEETPFNDLARIPIKCVQSVGESYFAPEYYKELILSHIDNINIFYVAATRAEEELHLMIPASKKEDNRINAIILNSIVTTDTSATIADMNGKISFCDSSKIIEFGEQITKHSDKTKQQDNSITIPFRTTEIGSRVKLRLPSQRYNDDGIQPTLSPRNYGILMHKAFEQATTIEEVEKAILLMYNNSTISQSESEQLREASLSALSNPIIRSWFTGEWEMIRNENDIIIPGGDMRRPDRVMINGNHAVIVDYKFGLERSPRHHKQISAYKELLMQMGYEKIEGYIWYVSLNDIEQA